MYFSPFVFLNVCCSINDRMEMDLQKKMLQQQL